MDLKRLKALVNFSSFLGKKPVRYILALRYQQVRVLKICICQRARGSPKWNQGVATL